jgi:hypothetical protein
VYFENSFYWLQLKFGRNRRFYICDWFVERKNVEFVYVILSHFCCFTGACKAIDSYLDYFFIFWVFSKVNCSKAQLTDDSQKLNNCLSCCISSQTHTTYQQLLGHFALWLPFLQ